jgi:chromosome segregation ATPase
LEAVTVRLAGEGLRKEARLNEMENDLREAQMALLRQQEAHKSTRRRLDRCREQNRAMRSQVRRLGGEPPDPLEDSLHPL